MDLAFGYRHHLLGDDVDFCSHASNSGFYPSQMFVPSSSRSNCSLGQCRSSCSLGQRMDYPVRRCDSLGSLYGSNSCLWFDAEDEPCDNRRDNAANVSKTRLNNQRNMPKRNNSTGRTSHMRHRHMMLHSKKSNENNNFMKDRRGKFTEGLPYNSRTWREENVFDRIDQLAKPKKNFAIEDNINLNKQPPNNEYQPQQNYFQSYCGQQPKTIGDPERLAKLSTPRTFLGEWCGRSPKQNRWECTYPFEDKYCKYGQIDPARLNWDRLAHCKVPTQPPEEDRFKVSKAALNAVASRRLEKLSVPRKVVNSDEYYLWLLNKKQDNDAKLKPIKRLSIHKIDLSGERVFLRCDLDHTKEPPSLETKVDRIRVTTQYCLNRGAKAVIIASHCGKPVNRSDCLFSLKGASEMLAKALNKEVVFLDDCIGPEAQALCEDPEPGSVFVLENLRYYPEEEGYYINTHGRKAACSKDEIQAFRARLFALGDVFIHDDFTSLVDMSNTTIGSQKQERAYGWNIFFELSKYNTFVTRPAQPMVAVIGGSFNNKIDVVSNIMGKAQEILLGGEIAQIFLKTLKGIDIGVTASSPTKEKKVLNAMSRAKDINCVVSLPSDLVVRNTRVPNQYFTVSSKSDVEPWFEIVDIGNVTRTCYVDSIKNAKSIVWSGEMGILLDATSVIGNAINDATASNFVASFIMDEETEQSFKTLVPEGAVTAVTGDGHVTSMLLHGKMPKGLAALSPYRKNIKKRQVKDEPVSFKPARIDKPGYSMATGFSKLCIDQLNVENKKVMIVCDLTAPVVDNKVTDNYALRMVVPTIKWVLKRGAKLVIISSPITTKEKTKDSLKPMAVEMEKLLQRKVQFVGESSGNLVKSAIQQAHHGTVIMLENNLDDQEEHYSFMMDTPSGSDVRRRTPNQVAQYCEMLSRQCDIWVNDAFSLLNKDRSSLTGCMHKIKPCGFLVKNELKYLSKTFNNPPRKFLAIIGGRNVRAAMDVMMGLMRDADEMIVTGNLGLHCLWILQGMRLGLSFNRSIQKADIQALLDFAVQNKVRLYFPVDIVTTSDLDCAKNLTYLSTSDGVAAGRYFVDVGPKTISLFSRIIKRSKFVLWCGVVGLCTLHEFGKGTRAVYDTIVECTQTIGQISIVGGEFLNKFVHGIDPNHEGLSHVTTGPEVMMKLLSEKHVVGLDAISFNSHAKVHFLNRLTMDQVELKDKRVLLRADFRAAGPRSGGGSDEMEVARQLATVIKNIFKKGAHCVTVFGHMGNPQGARDDTLSLLHYKAILEKLLKVDILFFDQGLTDTLELYLKTPETGKIYLLENMRFNPQEIGYGLNSNDQRINTCYESMDAYRERLTKLGDVFIMESMEALHTTDSSVVGIALENRVVGPSLKAELAAMSRVLPKIEHPLLAIVGGNEEVFEKTKIIYDIIDVADAIIVCGKTGLNFLKVLKNMPIGKDMLDKQAMKIIHRVMRKAEVQGVKLQLPVDYNVLVPGDPKDEESQDTTESFTVGQGIPESQRAIDVGEASLNIFLEMIEESKSIVLTGPVGLCHTELGSEGTRAVVEAMAANTEEGGISIAFGTQISNMCLNNIEESQGLSLISKGSRTVLDILLGRELPGLAALSLPIMKPLPVLHIENLNMKGKKVLLRLDLDVPTVEGVVLNTDKIEESLQTVRYILSKDPLCLILAGFRGNPRSYKNHYLSMKPLAMEFEHFLEKTVVFLEEPCSRKSRILCEDPHKGTVFLMENLKFYPAEVGQEEEMPDILNEELPEPSMSVSGIVGGPGASRKPSEKNISQGVRSMGENIDMVMYELMPFKSVDQYTREIGDCCDIYINDDSSHMWDDLTSNGGFDLNERACGYRLAEVIRAHDDWNELKKSSPAVASLSPAPKEN